MKHSLLWLRYVDDTITAVHENKIDEFHEHLNKQNTSIQFTKDIEENGKIPFLDCLVTRENNTVRNNCLQETNTHWQTTWPNVLQSYFTQSESNRTNLWREEHRLFATHDDTLTDKIKHLWTLFL